MRALMNFYRSLATTVEGAELFDEQEYLGLLWRTDKVLNVALS